MKVVVTGGSGFLGQRLIRALCERGRLSEGTRRGQIVLFDFGGATSYDPGPRDPCVFVRMQEIENEVPTL